MLTHADLRNYQCEMSRFQLDNPRSAEWVEMRLGKTVSTLTTLQELFYHKEIERALIVAPNMVVTEQVWPRENGRWTHLGMPGITVPNAHNLRLRILKRGAETHKKLFVTSYYNFLWLIATCHNNWPFDIIVFDESSALKDASTKRFVAAKHIVDKHPHVRVIQLTGTPTSSRGLLDLWSQVYMLDNGRALGTSFDSFQHRFFFNKDRRGYKWEPFPESAEHIYDLVSGFVYRLDAETARLELPEVLETETSITFPGDIRAVYKELERELLLEYENEPDIEAVSKGVLASKLLQLCNGAIYDEEGNVRWFHELKLDALEEIVAGTWDNLLVAYNYRFEIEAIKKRFPFAVHVKEKDAIKRWNRGEIPMLLAHPGTVAYGLDMYEGGHTFVWYGGNWSLELTQQFEARLKHPSQPPIIGHRIVIADTRDSDLSDTMINKHAHTQQALFAAMKKRMRDRVKHG